MVGEEFLADVTGRRVEAGAMSKVLRHLTLGSATPHIQEGHYSWTSRPTPSFDKFGFAALERRCLGPKRPEIKKVDPSMLH